VNERFAFDLSRAGRVLVGGADEAGRGCLAGPLVAAAVSFAYASWTDDDFAALERVDDSKRLSRQLRATLYEEVLRRAQHVVVIAYSAASIDRRGLQRCNVEALGAAVCSLEPTPAAVFVDGFALPGCSAAHEPLVRGDARSAAVAAASVVAKVTRDRVMLAMHERFPQYRFDQHVGYATELHQQMITAHGVCELHRRSFDAISYRQLGLRFEG
jgi:ribonuclease HII